MWIYYLIINLLAFAIYGIDKAKARAGAWRIAEKVLLGLGILGGAAGALAAMKLFRHKTRHGYFYVVNGAAMLLHIVLVVWLWL